MRHLSIVVSASAALLVAGCVQTRQYADAQFAVPSGDYKLLVMRPDVSVGSVTTGGLTEPRADWTAAARTNLLAALRAQQAGRGGNLVVLDRSKRNERPEPVATTDIMPTLAAMLGLSIDAKTIDGRCLSSAGLGVCPAR